MTYFPSVCQNLLPLEHKNLYCLFTYILYCFSCLIRSHKNLYCFILFSGALITSISKEPLFILCFLEPHELLFYHLPGAKNFLSLLSGALGAFYYLAFILNVKKTLLSLSEALRTSIVNFY